MTVTPEQAEIIYRAFEDRLIDLHVSTPGRVQSYDSATQTAEIELMVDRLLEDEDGNLIAESLPVIQNVPVIFPRTKKFILSFPIEAGDTGDVIFAETSIGQWRATGNVSAPEDIGRCTLSGAKFYPGLSADSDAIGDDLTQGALFGRIGGATLLIKEDDTIKLDSGSGTIEIKTGSGQVDINGNFTVDV